MTGMIYGERPGETKHLRLCNVAGCVTSREGALIFPNGTTFNLCEKHLARACRAIGLTREQVMP